MVNPGGTGRPMLAISARLAPLPPSRFFISFVPSALPPPKKKIRLLVLTAGAFLPAAVARPFFPFLCPFLATTALTTLTAFLSLATAADLDLVRLGMGAYLPWFVGCRKWLETRLGFLSADLLA